MNEQGNNTNQNEVVSATNNVNPVVSTSNAIHPVSPSNVESQPVVTSSVQQPVNSPVPSTGVGSQPINSVSNGSVNNAQPVSNPQTQPKVEPQPVTSNTNNASPVTPQINLNVEKTNVNPVNTTNVNMQSVPTPVPNSTNSNNINDNNNNPDYKPPGVFKTFILILFFGGLVAFIIFLPEIQAYVAEYRSGKTGVEEITSGKLRCSLDTNTTNLDKSFERVFVFSDKKLQSAVFTSITKGDITKDEKILDELYNACKLKKDSVLQIDGVTIACDYSDGLLTEREHFNYKEFDIEKVKSAYTEAGADLIEFEYGYDIDKINTAMLQAGFTCKKEK